MIRTSARLALCALALSFAMPSAAQAQTTGAVRFRIAKAGFILGGGTGILVFRGKTYRLGVSGVSVGTIGVANADLVGTAANLRNASDIAGSYVSASASIAAAAGTKSVRLRNAKGVVLDLRGRQVGLEASLNLGGIEISLRQ